MTDTRLARLLAATFLHTVTARRPALKGEWTTVWDREPCALSRPAQVASPEPPDAEAPLPESRYRYSLFTRPGVLFRLGDRLEISDGRLRYKGRASDSFAYPSHTVTVVEIREVEEENRAELP